MKTFEKLLSQLEDKIKTQLSYEYNDPERVQMEFENMTVADLLHMLNYMFKENDG